MISNDQLTQMLQ